MFVFLFNFTSLSDKIFKCITTKFHVVFKHNSKEPYHADKGYGAWLDYDKKKFVFGTTHTQIK